MTKNGTKYIEYERKLIAKCLNQLENVHCNLEVNPVLKQNLELKWQIEEAACKLGFSLATLSNWYDDEEKT